MRLILVLSLFISMPLSCLAQSVAPVSPPNPYHRHERFDVHQYTDSRTGEEKTVTVGTVYEWKDGKLVPQHGPSKAIPPIEDFPIQQEEEDGLQTIEICERAQQLCDAAKKNCSEYEAILSAEGTVAPNGPSLADEARNHILRVLDLDLPPKTKTKLQCDSYIAENWCEVSPLSGQDLCQVTSRCNILVDCTFKIVKSD